MSDRRLLENYLVPWRRRLRGRDGLRLAARTLWTAALGALLIELAARRWPLPERHLWALLPLQLWFLTIALYTWLRPLPLWRVARRLDRELWLKDRLATALELGDGQSGGKSGAAQTSPDQPAFSLTALQLADALAAIRDLSVEKLAWRLPRRPLGAAAALAGVALVLALLPNPMDAVLAHRAAVQEAAREQAAAIEKTRREFEQAATPTAEERAEALQALTELMKALAANPGDIEQALADLAAAEARLRRLQQPDAAARRTAVEQLATQLTALSRGEAQSSPEPARAGQAAAELAAALGAMDAAEQAELAGALEELAGQAAPTDADLAEALLEMAAAARTGDVIGAANAAGQARGALARAGQALALQDALAAAQARIAAGRDQLARSGLLAQGQGRSQSQSQGQSRGSGPGQSFGSGQPGSGGGTNANQLPGANRSGRAGAPTQPNRPPGLGESDTIYAPGGVSRLPGEPEFVAGREGEQGQTIIREEQAPQPGAANPALTPYRRVYEQYAAAAADVMERDRVPPEMQDYVRDYFSRLAPE